jgi:hypothetical protein
MEAAKAAAAQLAAQLPPPDPAFAERIEKTAFGVAKNGPQFEAMLVAKQQGNPQFEFLVFGGSANGYYRHVLNCMANGGWTLDQVGERAHKIRIAWGLPTLSMRVRLCPLGCKTRVSAQLLQNISDRPPFRQHLCAAE